MNGEGVDGKTKTTTTTSISISFPPLVIVTTFATTIDNFIVDESIFTAVESVSAKESKER